jgi:hypothetical protein
MLLPRGWYGHHSEDRNPHQLNSWGPEKLAATSRNSQYFVEPTGSLLPSQEASAVPILNAMNLVSHSHILFYFNIILPSMHRFSYQNFTFLSSHMHTTCPAISSSSIWWPLWYFTRSIIYGVPHYVIAKYLYPGPEELSQHMYWNVLLSLPMVSTSWTYCTSDTK